MSVRVVQALGALIQADGIGNIVRRLHAAAQRLSLESHICAREAAAAEDQEHRDPGLERIRSFVKDAMEQRSLFLYHYGLPDPELDAIFMDPRIVNRVFFFHNSTPAEFLRGWDSTWEAPVPVSGTMPLILDRCWIITGNSDFTIKRLPVQPTHTHLPPVLACSWDSLPTPGMVDLENKAITEIPSFLFVGEFAPNKRHDVLLFAIKDLMNAGIDGRLILAGKGGGAYLSYLLKLSRILGVHHNVQFLRDPDDEAVRLLYRHCQFFLIASEHEGFCEPLLEALKFGCVPIARPFTVVSDILQSCPTLAVDQSYSTFFDTIESVVRETFRKPRAFREIHARVSNIVAGNLSHYLSAEDFLKKITDQSLLFDQ